MSKPIKLTSELLQKIQDEFLSEVKSKKMFDGKIEYKKTFKWNDDVKATVYITFDAFSKLTALVQKFDSEVAWHGVVHRSEKDPFVFSITDILMYPQVVTGTTVNTDQTEYQNWLYAFDDEIFSHIRMQGHSHVNMSVSPSGVDTAHQEKILEQISNDDFYIFMIWNKKLDHFIRIFDLKNNTLFETEDVNIYIGDGGIDIDAFITEAKKMVKPKIYTPAQQGSVYLGGYSSGYPGVYHPGNMTTFPSHSAATVVKPATPPANAGVKTKPKSPGVGMSYMEYQRYGFPGCDDEDDDAGLYIH